jgi:hypothetical protein
MPVADADTITVTFENVFALFRDLRGMAETNALALRPKRFMRRELLANAVRRYAVDTDSGLHCRNLPDPVPHGLVVAAVRAVQQ